MSYRILSNKENGAVTIHFNAANTMTIAGNTTNGSNVAKGSETLTGGYISQAFWGTDGSGTIQLRRGGTLVAIFDSTGYKDYAGSGMPLSANSDQTIAVTFVGSANAYLMLEVQKTGTIQGRY